MAKAVEFKNVTWNLKQINRMVKNGKLEFAFPIQRKSGAWTEHGKSLLIVSAVNEYPIPPVYLVGKKPTEEQIAKNAELRATEEGADIAELKMTDTVRYIIDGLQRISTFIKYMNDEFALTANTPNVEVEGKEYEIAGKKYSELDEEVQDMIDSRSLVTYTVDGDKTDFRVIDQIFLLMNNGVSLKNDQKIKPTLGSDIAPTLEQFDTHTFVLRSTFSKAQIMGDSHISAILQYLMLEECLNDAEEINDFSIHEIMNYATLFGSFDSQTKLDTLAEVREIMDFGGEMLEAGGFTKKVKFLKRVNFPMVVAILNKAKTNGIDPAVVAEWFNKFIVDTIDSEHVYNAKQGQGTTKYGSFMHRYNVMAEDFNTYLKGKGIELTVEAIGAVKSEHDTEDVSITSNVKEVLEADLEADKIENTTNEAVEPVETTENATGAVEPVETTENATGAVEAVEGVEGNENTVEEKTIPAFKTAEKVKLEANIVNNPVTEVLSDYLLKGKKLQFLAEKFVNELLAPALTENPNVNEITFNVEEDIGNGVATFGISMNLISETVAVAEKTIAFISHGTGEDGEVVKSAVEAFKKEISTIVGAFEAETNEYVMFRDKVYSNAETSILVSVK